MKHKLDQGDSANLSADARMRLQAVADKPDETIDYSDIPDISAAFWADHRPKRPDPKAQVTLRIDQDVIDFFKQDGSGYQTRINAVLRSFVKAHTPTLR